MKESRILLNYRDLTVEVETSPGKKLKEHMHNTVLGQPGSFRYRQKLGILHKVMGSL